MDSAKFRVKLIKFIRLYPLIVVAVLLIAFLLGGFDRRSNSDSEDNLIITLLYLFAAITPLLVIISFMVIGRSSDKQFKQNKGGENTLNYSDAFNLPSVNMHGYKLATITGKSANLTGLTGDTYLADAAAACNLNPNHTPPVAECECGFYAYKNLSEAKFERSVNPGSFVIEVDLYGLGFEYQRGYRAERQVVKKVFLPKRCMRCRVLTPKVFVTTFKLGYGQDFWWQWQARCQICSLSFKSSDKLEINQMASKLKVAIV